MNPSFFEWPNINPYKPLSTLINIKPAAFFLPLTQKNAIFATFYAPFFGKLRSHLSFDPI